MDRETAPKLGDTQIVVTMLRGCGQKSSTLPAIAKFENIVAIS